MNKRLYKKVIEAISTARTYFNTDWCRKIIANI